MVGFGDLVETGYTGQEEHKAEDDPLGTTEKRNGFVDNIFDGNSSLQLFAHLPNYSFVG